MQARRGLQRRSPSRSRRDGTDCSGPVSGEEAVIAGLAAAQFPVGALVVDRLADRGVDEAFGVEARLEVVQRVLLAAEAAPEVEALEAAPLRPACGLQQDEGGG